MSDASDDPSLRAVLRGRRGALLVAMLLTELAVSVDRLGAATVLPVAAHELGGASLYTAALTAAQVMQIACMAFGAAIYGRLGPVAQLWVATIVWLAGAVTTVLAPSMPWIVAGMAVRGVGGGLMAGLGIGVLSRLYDGPRARERAFGLFALMWVLPSLVAPAVNAVLLSLVGWRLTLAWPALVLLAGRALIGSRLRLVDHERTRVERPRGAWSLLALACVLAAVQAAIAMHDGPWIAVAVVLVVVAAMPMRSALGALVPTAARVRSHAWTMSLAAVGCFGISALLPLLAAARIDATGTVGAFLVAITPLAWTTLSSTGIATRLATPAAARAAGIAFGSAGMLGAAWLVLADSPPWLGIAMLVAAAALAGLGMGVIYPRVLSGAFVDFAERGGTTRAHAAVSLDLAETTGSIAGASVVAGVIAALLATDARAGAAALGIVAVLGMALWMRAARSLDAHRPPDGPQRR